jgi:hypothetical protein
MPLNNLAFHESQLIEEKNLLIITITIIIIII